jgi:hypothetical protein
MQIEEIVDKIGKTIANLDLEREEKINRLKRLADECWNEVFPERGTPQYEELSVEERHRRWESVRGLVRQRQDADYVFKVLDWPGSGGDFHWVR